MHDVTSGATHPLGTDAACVARNFAARRVETSPDTSHTWYSDRQSLRPSWWTWIRTTSRAAMQQVLDALIRNDLLEVADRHELAVSDSRVRDQLVDAAAC
jgi:hypothetical protein